MHMLFSSRNLAPKTHILIVLALATVILFLRKTDSFINPQFWAEDGAVFFLQQYNQGALAIVQPYAGYLHVVPRLIALFSDIFFPYSATPYVYNYASLILTLLVIANIYSRRFVSTINKTLLSLAIVLVPHYTNEVFLNITNLQWILAILIIITLLKESPLDTKYGNVYLQIVIDFTVIISCGLTGPLIIFLIPFFVWKCFNKKSNYSFSIVLAVIAVASIQIFFIINNAPLLSGRAEVNYELYAYTRVIGQKLFGNLFLGMSVPYKINSIILCGLLLLTILFIVYLSVGRQQNKTFLIVVFLSFFFAILVATLNKFKSSPLVLIPPGNGSRYFYLPYVMIVWSLITCIDQKEIWKSSLVEVLLIVVLISSLTSGFHSKSLDRDWQSYSKLIGKEQNLIIPINPEGWYIHIKKK